MRIVAGSLSLSHRMPFINLDVSGLHNEVRRLEMNVDLRRGTVQEIDGNAFFINSFIRLVTPLSVAADVDGPRNEC